MRINSLANILQTGVSHNANIRKQLIIANGEIEHITNFSRAVFPPGECAPAHVHTDMIEVFFIESGTGEICINNQVISLQAGTCITVEAGEQHELRNTGSNDMSVLYFGVQL